METEKSGVTVTYYHDLHISKMDHLWMIATFCRIHLISFILTWWWILPFAKPMKVILLQEMITISPIELITRLYACLCLLFISWTVSKSGLSEYWKRWLHMVEMTCPNILKTDVKVAFTTYQMKHPNDDDSIKNYYMELTHHFGEPNGHSYEFVLHFSQCYKNAKAYDACTYGGTKIFNVAVVVGVDTNDGTCITDLGSIPDRERRVDWLPKERLLVVHLKGDGLENHFSEIRQAVKKRMNN